MHRRMPKRDKVARLLLTADKVNSFLLKSQISSLCLRRSSAFVPLFVACVIAFVHIKRAFWCRRACRGSHASRRRPLTHSVMLSGRRDRGLSYPIKARAAEVTRDLPGCVSIAWIQMRRVWENKCHVWSPWLSWRMGKHLVHVICLKRKHIIFIVFITWLQSFWKRRS